MKGAIKALVIGGVCMAGTLSCVTAIHNVWHGCAPWMLAYVEYQPGVQLCPGQIVTLKQTPKDK
jgi:hypothetical protein